MNRRHRGIALVTAILVVAIASLAATALLVSANMAIHRTSSLRDTEQGWWMARGVEAWVRGILKQDATDSAYDGLDEAWAQPVDYLPVDHGFVRGQIVDQQGLFNLNNLASAQPQKAQIYQAQFQRLLGNLSNIAVPPGLTASIRDWIDNDQNPGLPVGAEDTVYLNLPLPYRTGDHLLTAVSELLAIHEVTPELYAALRGLITVLPVETPINVNTAPRAVMIALSDSPDQAALDSFLEERAETPAQDVPSFMSRNIFGADVTPDRISVTSAYFQMQGEIVVGSSRTALYSLIHRPKPGTPVVLAHSADSE